jgi:hypothetical protein
MNGMLVKGYARQVPPHLVKTMKGRVWYLPHYAVYHPKTHDKVRVVFDCSARFDGTALNDKLLQGEFLGRSVDAIPPGTDSIYGRHRINVLSSPYT